jgi:dTDP-4-amino-4,6-dideoxygalactose transaminase
MPPREEYQKYLEGIWEREYLTNNGPLVKELEKRLTGYLGVKHLLYVSNGTIALQIAIKALALKGEIITTPFSYVATTSSIVWEGCKPVFIDIDPQTLNINPELIEGSITSKTSAILATHVFGNPCDIEAIEAIAQKHNLKVIYDAAHCFGTAYKGRSVFNYGDVSATSFHATKIFHTVEGGALFTSDEDLKKRMHYMRNFGHDGPAKFNGVGINGKNSEFHAAMGLCNLNYIKQIIAKRKHQFELYNRNLKWKQISKIKIREGTDWNYSYYPVIFRDERSTLSVMDNLKKNDVYSRRYFYPSLETLDYVDSGKLPVSGSIAGRILCLPMYHSLTDSDILRNTNIINQSLTVPKRNSVSKNGR